MWGQFGNRGFSGPGSKGRFDSYVPPVHTFSTLFNRCIFSMHSPFLCFCCAGGLERTQGTHRSRGGPYPTWAGVARGHLPCLDDDSHQSPLYSISRSTDEIALLTSPPSLSPPQVAFWILAGEDHIAAAESSASNTPMDIWTSDPYALVSKWVPKPLCRRRSAPTLPLSTLQSLYCLMPCNAFLITPSPLFTVYPAAVVALVSSMAVMAF